jgi:hypothetical protein
MEDEVTRAKHYVELAKMMRRVGHDEPDVTRKNELLDLARQYDRLAEKLSSEVRH